MKKIKLLKSACLITTAVLPLSTTLTSCSNEYYKKNYSSSVIDVANKLVEMNKNPRCSTSEHHWWNLSAIRQWIFQQASLAGVDSSTFGRDNYGNIWFDVEATEGCEAWQPLILQGHMDMVVSGLTAETKEITPIDTVIDWKNGLVHSRDYKTTVGADNGAGIAIMLNLIQDKTIKHGPLRIICSADEDSGMIGAAALYDQYVTTTPPTTWNPFTNMGNSLDGTPIKYLLNIDAEELGTVYKGCAGSATYTYTNTFRMNDEEEALANKVYIDVKGFKGGHSGEDLSHNRASAEECIFEILYGILNKSKNVQIVQHYHPSNDGDISYQRNAIVPHARVVINTDASLSEISTIISNKVLDWKEKYTSEDWSQVGFTVANDTTMSHDKYMSKEDSAKLINFIGPNDQPVVGEKMDHLWYGYISDPAEAGSYTMCANISPLEIKYDEKHAYFKVNVSSQTRTRGVDNFNKMEECYKDIAIEDTKFTVGSRYSPWSSDGHDKLVQICTQAYTDVGITPNPVSSTGGIEPSWWSLCNPNLNCAGIGPDIKDAHAITERLYLNTVQSVLDVIKKVMLAMETAQ